MRQIFVALILSIFPYTIVQAKELQNDTIVRYYDLTNKAELSICEGQTLNAIKLYDTAYLLMGKKMFFRHFYNYFIASIETKNYNKAKDLLSVLKEQGFAENNYIELIKLYYEPDEQKKLLELFSNTTAKQHLDKEYIRTLDSMTNIDQKVNNYYRSINNGLLDDFGHDTLNKIIESNMKYLSVLFREKFPTDARLGREGGPAFHVKYSLMLIHNIMIGTFRDKGWGNYHYLDSILYQGVLRGEFDPVDFEADISSPIGFVGSDSIRYLGGGKQIIVPLDAYDFAIINDSLFEFVTKVDRVALVAKRRESVLGLAKSEDFRKKLVYQFYNPRYNFVPQEYITLLKSDELPPSVKAKFRYIPKP